jgi:hydrogenase maturation protein HypF
MGGNEVKGAAISFKGIVQGVGFRPLVYRRAIALDLKGTIRNTSSGVLVEVDGREHDIQAFYREMLANPPVLAEIHSSSMEITATHGFEEFSIIGSVDERWGFTPISPDIATCAACLGEIRDRSNRRYRYPFTNCTDCGPRFTIIRSIPYDRRYTTMNAFQMCPDCSREYEDPLDRRYHAQPNACAVCGPALELRQADGTTVQGDPISRTIEMLRAGSIVAIKGLGGYHLALLPFDRDRIRRLRERKGRPAKPFALMARDLETARRFCRIGEEEEKLLCSTACPIVLLRRRLEGESLPRDIAPDTEWLGLMLPYTPLHHLLMDEGPELLIMTSANLSEEPLCFDDADAERSLTGIADAFLLHNRGIHRPCDDSVVMVVEDMPVFLRRSRGYVPKMVRAPASRHQLLATGSYEKNTFCVFKEGKAFVSHHIGDLSNEKSVDAYTRGIHDFIDMFRVTPSAVACDLHPDYESTRYAEKLSDEWGVPLIRVQHHHAHISAVLGVEGLHGPVIGVALDGTGYGPDGTVWGGEFLVADTAGFERLGHYAAVPMPGGEKCIEDITRMGVSYLLEAFGAVKDIPDFPFVRDVGLKAVKMYGAMIRSGFNTPLTSSCGRLFDAVSALLGLCSRPTYDAQGALLLEHAAGDMERMPEPYGYDIDDDLAIHFGGMIRGIVEDLICDASIRSMAQRFHATVVRSGVTLCGLIRERTGLSSVVLGGGVFQNRLILRHFRRELGEGGFTVHAGGILPPNDGGLSYGQGVTALTLLEGGI